MPCDQDRDSDTLSSQSSGAEEVGRTLQEMDVDADTFVAPIVDAKSMLETIKGHLIGTNKLQWYLETAKQRKYSVPSSIHGQVLPSLIKPFFTPQQKKKQKR
jgi:hypothetical protein